MKAKSLILAIVTSVLTLALPSGAQNNLNNKNMNELSKQLKEQVYKEQCKPESKYKYTSEFIKCIKQGNVTAEDLEIIINISPDDNTLFDTALEVLTEEEIINNFPSQILFDKADTDNRDMIYQTAAIIEKIGGNPDDLKVHYKLQRADTSRLKDGKKEYITEKDGTLLNYWADNLSDTDNDKILAVAKVLIDNNATITDEMFYHVNKYGSEKSKELLNL